MAADHITALDQALAKIPDGHRHGNNIPIRFRLLVTCS
jgi:hypothetical protein